MMEHSLEPYYERTQQSGAQLHLSRGNTARTREPSNTYNEGIQPEALMRELSSPPPIMREYSPEPFYEVIEQSRTQRHLLGAR